MARDLSAGAARGLLERATSYTLGNLQAVTPDHMHAATPCTGWDLRTLLQHLNESLDLITTCLGVDDNSPAADPVCAFRTRATSLMGALALDRPNCPVAIAGRYRVSIALIAATGAVEVAVHGWDVARATDADRPIPCDLAGDLWGTCRLLTADAEQHRLFAPAITPAAAASRGDQLVAMLGRNPATSGTALR